MHVLGHDENGNVTRATKVYKRNLASTAVTHTLLRTVESRDLTIFPNADEQGLDRGLSAYTSVDMQDLDRVH
jgi:hypothetical protein